MQELDPVGAKQNYSWSTVESYTVMDMVMVLAMVMVWLWVLNRMRVMAIVIVIVKVMVTMIMVVVVVKVMVSVILRMKFCVGLMVERRVRSTSGNYAGNVSLNQTS